MSISDKIQSYKTDRLLKKIAKATHVKSKIYLRKAEKNIHDEEAFKDYATKALDLMDISHQAHFTLMKDR